MEALMDRATLQTVSRWRRHATQSRSIASVSHQETAETCGCRQLCTREGYHQRGMTEIKNFVVPRAAHPMDNTGDDAAIVQFSILPSIPCVVSMPRLHVGQELGDHLEIALWLLQVRHMGALLEDL